MVCSRRRMPAQKSPNRFSFSSGGAQAHVLRQGADSSCISVKSFPPPWRGTCSDASPPPNAHQLRASRSRVEAELLSDGRNEVCLEKFQVRERNRGDTACCRGGMNDVLAHRFCHNQAINISVGAILS